MPKPNKRQVAIGLLGPMLDSGKGTTRWERWRPTVSLFQHEDLAIDRFELLFEPKFTALKTIVSDDIRSVSPQTEVREHQLHFADAWDFQDVFGGLHDFCRSYAFNPDEEDYLVHITTGTHVAQICLFLLTESRYFPGKLIQTAPPTKWGSGPGSYGVVDLDLSKYDRLASRFDRETRESTSLLKSGIETRSDTFNRLIERIERVAVASKAPILLNGPTGAGKSHLARQIYELKKSRRQIAGPFVEVNCATLRGDGAMSALFGHVKGSFTGAASDRPGLLRAADGGLLFLDEIGELGTDEQAMLLRAIEEKRFLPVGSDKEARSDFQLIAGTNCDLPAAVAGGRFREDLLARINLWTFALPPLRERREDIEPNLTYELERFAQREGVKVAFNREARERFLAFAIGGDATWIGNFRDLNAAVTRMATLAAGGRITVETVAEEVDRLRRQWASTSLRDAGRASDDECLGSVLTNDAMEKIDRFDRVQLAEVIRVCRQSRTLSDAGRTLFAASRAQKAKPNDADRLRKYLARFGLDWEKACEG
ncbi:RNA repair transcriptional activator RtcR [Humisphaera borealis]|uniref:Sigma 54-interacting transcriptional regulator n=1 Tax=Humisphaera borealis TaxID=2807512 RepID=A0A7M2WQP9_9BACT|nr:RNA repair transcriptional activator RtcR [Humisphaera borealis]QOV87564.1 sigma 54-interacting transcriptional regulator [Humisphaera borealis]